MFEGKIQILIYMKSADAFQAGQWPSLISILKIFPLLLCREYCGGKGANTGACEEDLGQVLGEEKQLLEYWPIVKNNTKQTI